MKLSFVPVRAAVCDHALRSLEVIGELGSAVRYDGNFAERIWRQHFGRRLVPEAGEAVFGRAGRCSKPSVRLMAPVLSALNHFMVSPLREFVFQTQPVLK